jgi:hypothetical protein
LLAPPIVLSAVAQDRIIGVASVIDGDSIEIHGQRIRPFCFNGNEDLSRWMGLKWLGRLI